MQAYHSRAQLPRRRVPDFSPGTPGDGGRRMSCVELLEARSVPGLSGTVTSHHLELPPTPVAAGRARAFVSKHAGAGDVVLLLTSEIVTNAVLHARTDL